MTLYPDFTRLYAPDCGEDHSNTWILFHGQSVVVNTNGDSAALPVGSRDGVKPFEVLEPLLLGRLGETVYHTANLPQDSELPVGFVSVDVRKLYGMIPVNEWQIVGYASQILHWRRTSRFCPVCGHTTEPMQREWMRHCSSCGHSRYPQVSPAVLMLVHNGTDRVLLAHKPGWSEMYSIFAGFVLPGESLEECVHREVAEESGVIITDLVYQGSQPWPFPHQLMVGFTARYVGGEITIDEEELDRVEWFDARHMPALPGPLSLSRQIIDTWVQGRAGARHEK